MKLKCPKCCENKESIVKYGKYYRQSDAQVVSRYKCKACGKHFSLATFSPCYRQKKRRINNTLRNSLCSTMSQRRFAKIYRISRTTVARKLKFLAEQARLSQKKWLSEQETFTHIQFDDLETFEHSKCKPITVTLLVNENRKIIDFGVAAIGAKGHLTQIARKKYGRRKNDSFSMRKELFKRVQPYIHSHALIQSDEHPHYSKVITEFFPNSCYERFKGVSGCVSGQGELKKIKFDPLFKINHTFAMLRANINRLIRKTWCTTKKIESLNDHIALYVDFHNRVLTKV